MEATLRRYPTSIRFREDIYQNLRSAAEIEHRSVTNFLEFVLLDWFSHHPNHTTIKAMEEARRGEGLEVLDLSNFDSYVQSL